jgi:hypothetical protein
MNSTQKIDRRAQLLLDTVCPNLPELQDIRDTAQVCYLPTPPHLTSPHLTSPLSGLR